jgi:hypothetical protein
VVTAYHTEQSKVYKQEKRYTISYHENRLLVRMFLQLSANSLHCVKGQAILKPWYSVLKVCATLTYPFSNISKNKQKMVQKWRRNVKYAFSLIILKLWYGEELFILKSPYFLQKCYIKNCSHYTMIHFIIFCTLKCLNANIIQL